MAGFVPLRDFPPIPLVTVRGGARGEPWRSEPVGKRSPKQETTLSELLVKSYPTDR